MTTPPTIFYFPTPDHPISFREVLLFFPLVTVFSTLLLLFITFCLHSVTKFFSKEPPEPFWTMSTLSPCLATTAALIVCGMFIELYSYKTSQDMQVAPWLDKNSTAMATSLIEKAYGVEVIDHADPQYPWSNFTVKRKDGHLQGGCSLENFTEGTNAITRLHLTPPPHTVPAYVLCNGESLTPTS